MALDQASCLIVDDDLLNFSLDDDNHQTKPSYSSFHLSNPNSEDPDHYSRSFTEFAEEELEWLSNKDSFPAVETCFNTLTSPASVLENSTSTITSCCDNLKVPITYPVRKRSNCRRRRRSGFPEPELKPPEPPGTASGLGRRCQHCLAEKTPQWRLGPMGPKTLCNACGVRYKSGRLVPEYRPASSPSFCTALHSNSHRKIMEMRKKIQNVL